MSLTESLTFGLTFGNTFQSIDIWVDSENVTNLVELDAFLAANSIPSGSWDLIWAQLGYVDADDADDALYSQGAYAGGDGILKSDILDAWAALNAYHEDVQDWNTRLTAAGGSASTTTLEALDAFANSIETAGIRDRFYRLNVFAGDGLTSALVPFYLGPVTGGTVYGYEYDQNVGPFLSSDYSESTGLKGDGLSKRIHTGLAVDDFVTSDMMAHVSGDRLDSSDSSAFLVSEYTNGRFAVAVFGGKTNGVCGSTAEVDYPAETTGLIIASRESTSLITLFADGSDRGENTANQSHVSSSEEFVCFARKIGTSYSYYYSGHHGGYSLGKDLDATQRLAYNSAWASLRSALGRSLG